MNVSQYSNRPAYILRSLVKPNASDYSQGSDWSQPKWMCHVSYFSNRLGNIIAFVFGR